MNISVMQLGSHVNSESTKNIGFSWRDVIANMRKQKWEIYEPSLSKMNDPAWKLLYDESPTGIKLDESDEKTLVLTLSHADTVRINAEPGSNASKGSQYFWLSKDCYDFFPPLTIRNRRGTKATYSCIIKLNYVDLDGTTDDCRVTFEAENNLDFRLGTGKLRHTRIAKTGDLATIMRIKESQYELRIFKKDSKQYDDLKKYAIHHIGHQGKRYGYISNEEFQDIIRN